MFNKKNKALLMLPFIAACSVNSSVSTTTLDPLINTTTSTYLSSSIHDSAEFQFIDDFYYYYGIDGSTFVPYSDQYLIDTAYLWCELMNGGMTNTDIIERINEGGTEQYDINIHIAMIKSAVINLCEDNYTIWYN